MVQAATEADVQHIVDFGSVGMGDVARVGGKNASIGEMLANLSAAGVRVPGGFATTADAFRAFLAQDGLVDRVHELLSDVDGNDVALLSERGRQVLHVTEAELVYVGIDPSTPERRPVPLLPGNV